MDVSESTAPSSGNQNMHTAAVQYCDGGLNNKLISRQVRTEKMNQRCSSVLYVHVDILNVAGCVKQQ